MDLPKTPHMWCFQVHWACQELYGRRVFSGLPRSQWPLAFQCPKPHGRGVFSGPTKNPNALVFSGSLGLPKRTTVVLFRWPIKKTPRWPFQRPTKNSNALEISAGLPKTTRPCVFQRPRARRHTRAYQKVTCSQITTRMVIPDFSATAPMGLSKTTRPCCFQRAYQKPHRGGVFSGRQPDLESGFLSSQHAAHRPDQTRTLADLTTLKTQIPDF